MASGSSQAAHSTSAPLRKHDVFLSFYGKDTRKGFSDHLYTALKHKGIFVYRDNEELKRGENISKLLKAIQESEYAIVVISENYAFSKWCLKELTEIMKCKRECRLTILPIFYHVDPFNVRNQKGSFVDGLAKHEEESKEEKEKWRSALKELGNTAGWHVHDSYESKIVQEVCREIFVGLSRRLSIYFKDIIEIESQVKEMMILLRAKGTTNDVRFIGICGMGGIGRTTLAQVIFNNIFLEFEATCFIDDVEEKLKRHDIVHLQEQLIHQILGDRDIKIWGSFHAIKEIANRFQEKKIFLVLDNVSKASQIEALAKSHSWFGQGSRILLTIRNKQLLKRFADEIYEVNGLNDNDALRLFGLKSFKKNCPIKNYEKLSKEFVDYAKGLPLAIEVFGSLLLEKELPIWETTLKQLKEEPHVEIWKKVKISFDDLSYSQKELFLDIACFFNRMPIDDVMQYLESVGYFPKSNIEVLQDRSLIKVSHGIFEMHDLLQDMGQRIAREKSLKNPNERNRLWCSKDIIHVLENNTGTEAVEGIFLRLPLPKPTKLNFEGFSKMKRLKLLVIRPTYFHQHDISNDKIVENLRTMEWFGNPSKFMLSNELRFLEWWGYPLEFLPTNFEPSNLIKLKIPMSNINHLWSAEKNFEKLKYIDLKLSQNLMEMPDFSQVPNLERLNVRGTKIRQLSTTVLPEKLNVLHGGSFSKPTSLVVHGLPLNLKSLALLDLSDCNLTDEMIPNDFGCLSLLRYLDLLENKFTGIDFVSKLPNLRKLELFNCGRLKALPPKLSSRLPKIDITNCRSLTTFSEPRDILTSSEGLVVSDMTLQAKYIGYDGQHYCSTHLGQSFLESSFLGPERSWLAVFYSMVVTWGPTLTSDVAGWFTSFPDISGIFQRRFEVKSWNSLEATKASLYYDKVKNSSGNYCMTSSLGHTLFIVYEVLEHDSCQVEGGENGNFSSTVFPVFVCKLEVHKINDRKVPIDWYRRRISMNQWEDMGKDLKDYDRHLAEEWRTLEKVPREYGRTLGKVRMVFRVPNIPSAGRNGVSIFISANCFDQAGLDLCENLGLCSISISSLNVEVKEYGGRLVLKNDRLECSEIIKSISPYDLDPETLRKAFYHEGNGLWIYGPIRKKHYPSSTSSEMLMGRDTSEFEACYFGYDGKRYRTYHLAQLIINDLHSESLYHRYVWDRPQLRHFATVTWGSSVASDIPEWFTSLPDISRIFQHRFEAEAQHGYLSLPCEPRSWYYGAVEKNRNLVEIYEIFESDSCQRKGEIHEVEVDEARNSSSAIFPVFVCKLGAHGITNLEFPMSFGPYGKVPIFLRVPDIPSIGRSGVWVFINSNCSTEAGPGLCSIRIGSLNVDVEGSRGHLVLKNDSSECHEIITSISPHRLDLETLQDAFYEGGFGVFGDMITGEKRKEGKEQKGIEIYEEREKEGVEIWEEEEEEVVEIFEEEEEEGVQIFEKREKEKGEISEEGQEEGIEIFEEGEEEGVEICEKIEEVLKERKRKRKRKNVGVEICEKIEKVLKERKRKKVGVEICEEGEEILKERKRKKVGVEICEKGEKALKERKRKNVGVEICEKREKVLKERRRKKVGIEICEEGEEILKERKRKKVGVEICEEGEKALNEMKRKKVGVEISEKGEKVLKERRKKVGVEICEEGEKALNEMKRKKVGVEISEKGEEILKERKRKKVGVEICEKGEKALKEMKRKNVGVEISEKREKVFKERRRRKKVGVEKALNEMKRKKVGVEISEKREKVLKERKRKKVSVEVYEKGKEVLKESKRKKLLESVKKGKRKKVGVEICEKGEKILKERKRKKIGVEICEEGEKVLKESKRKKVLNL